MKLELYFLRHAEAVGAASSDADRTLTAKGIRDVKTVAVWLKNQKVSFDKIVSSPYLRARQSAELVAEGTGFSKGVEFSDVLLPAADFHEFFKLLKSFSLESKILFVGHQPSLGKFVAGLTSKIENASLELQKSSLSRVDMCKTSSSGEGELKWVKMVKSRHG